MLKSSLVLAAFLASATATAAVDKYKIDNAHTSLVFKINHMGFSNTYGVFTGGEGMFTIDESKPDSATVELKIKSDSINTLNAKRDQHLKSPDFFNVKANPVITFKSKSIKKTGADTYKVEGDFAMNGVTKPVSFDFKRGRTGKGMQGETRTGGDAVLKLKRSDYNMKFMNGENQIGDDVDVMISLEGVRE